MKNFVVLIFLGSLIFLNNPKNTRTNERSFQLSGKELLEKSISYHDPTGLWNKFKGILKIRMTRPERTERNSQIEIDISKSFFKNTIIEGKNKTEQVVVNDNCNITFNGRNTFYKDEIQKHKLTCSYALKMRDYFTYLYGLPMKLKDPGTIIHSKINSKVFKGKKYLVLKVDYEEPVGSDRWYFYFNPESYKLEAYQFFHDESINDGEYILLSDEKEINGIKMPKIRSWFYNKEDKFLGTDILN